MYNVQGLINLGNTCFINATIQCLNSLKPFRDYLLENISNYNYGLTEKFIKLLKFLNNKSSKEIYLNEFIDFFYSTNLLFKRNEQDDSYFFLVTLLNSMNKELKTTFQDNYIEKFFLINIETKTIESFSNKIEIELEPSFCISLPLQSKNYIYSDLDECLKGYQTTKEIIDTYTRKTYKDTTKIIPKGKFLILNLQRVSNGRHIKNLIKYKEFIELNGMQYELKALIKHIGDEYGGHKIAICKDVNSNWYEFDDNKVRPFSKQLPQEQLAFLLFYQKYEEIIVNNDYTGNGIISGNHLAESTQIVPSSSNSLITLSISDINELYKKYEQQRKDEEKNIINFFKQLNKKSLKNKDDFFKYFHFIPSNTIKIQEFKEYYGIEVIPDKFIKNDKIDLFKLIYSYSTYLEDSQKTTSSKSSNKYRK